MQQAQNQTAKPTESLSIHRWYDMDPTLGELVRTMEQLSPNNQAFFAFLIKHSAERIIKIRGREFIRKLDWTVFLGLIKSKSSRRWYDQEPTQHQAFNLLYSLSDADKAVIARELNPSAEIVLRYESYARNKGQSIVPTVVQRIVETCIKEGPDKARAQFDIFH